MPYNPPLIASRYFAANPTPLPVRPVGDPGGPDYVVKAVVAAQEVQGVVLNGTTKANKPVTITVRMVAPGVVRVLLEGAYHDPTRVTLTKPQPENTTSIAIETTEQAVKLASAQVTVEIQLNPFHMTYCGPDGQVFLDQDYDDSSVTDVLMTLPFGMSEIERRTVAFHDSFKLEPDEHFYGFGEKFTDLDKRSQRIEMWNYDAYGANTEHAYKNVPFFISTRGYGIFVDSVTFVNFDMGHGSHSVFSLIVPDTALDYYVIAGPDPKTILTRYASLVSFPILPPKWAFGFWMSSGFAGDNADEVLSRARSLREYGIPTDIMHLDCYWQRFGRWSEMLWDTAMFPDPAGLIREIKAIGYKVCLWINPYIGVESERFTEGRDKGYFLKTPNGEVYVAQLWGDYHPPVAIIDLTNPDAYNWYKEMLREQLKIGVDVFKSDFGEGVPEDAVAFNGMTGKQLHNLYTLIYNDLVASVTAEETGRAGLVWGRSTYAGGQRHAAQWGGDPNCTYQSMASTLRGGLSMGLSGHPFWSHDIGGFHRQPTPDVYIRWAQFGLFSPLTRAHGMTTRLPWKYGDEALRIFREYTLLRYHLMPYIYTHAAISAQTSWPMLRAMVLEFPADPNTYTLDLQYMFGDALLVAPIYNITGRRSVYFPQGRWIDYWTHEIIEGPTTRFIEAPLDVLPLYVRANALIPTLPEAPQFMTDAPFEQVTFDGYLFDSGSFELYDSDGTTRLSASRDGARLSIQLEGAKSRVGLRLVPLAGVPTMESVTVNGKTINRVDKLESGAGWTVSTDGTVDVVVVNQASQ